MYYKLKNNILWRNELNSFMLLHPENKKLLIFPKYISDNISINGIIREKKETENFIKFLNSENLLDNIDILNSNEIFGSGELTAPLNVTLQITDKCNLKCIHCHRKDKGVIDLSLSKVKLLIDELVEMKVFNINVSGGEALMHPDVYSIFEYGFGKGLKMTMSTNGILLTDNNVKKLYDLGLRQVHISLDSYLDNKHDLIRGVKNSFFKTITNLNILKKYGINFTLVTTLVNQDFDEYKKIIDLAYTLGASAHKTNLLIPQGQGSNLQVNYYNDSKILDKYIKIFKLQREKFSGKMNVIGESMFLISSGENIVSKDDKKPDILKIGCPAGFTTSAITELGEVLPCPFFSELEVGNINNDTFKNIWNNSNSLNKIRRRGEIKGCGKCNFKDSCGGCRARVFGIEGVLNNEDKYCFKNIN
nr:radical SAM protein [Candidatus Gracilibacteria bacterium]